jgi:PPOX class probable F420-dependent enzyme
MPRLTPAQVAQFLDEPGHLVRTATVDADGMPRVVPTWFVVDDGVLLFTPRSASVLWQNLERDPRLGLSIDDEAPPYRKVTLQGRAHVVHPAGEDEAWREVYLRIAGRYIPADDAARYVYGTVDQPRPLVGVALSGDDVVVTTWRMPLAGEDPTGMWHRRYYAEGTPLAERASNRASEAGPTG